MSKYTLILMLFITSMMYTQNSSISGKIQTDNKVPLVGASIVLDKTSTGVVSDNKGNYIFNNLKKGTYNIKVSYLGYMTDYKEVTINFSEDKVINFTLLTETNSLQEVEITGRKAKTYTNATSFIGTKVASKVKDIPQAISYVTKEVFQDQQAFKVNDIIKNISGVGKFSRYDDFVFRGFRGGDTYINGLKAHRLFGPRALLGNIERVEVIKGPASAMFGNANPGGVINRVTKKPLAVDRKSISFTTGSFNTLRSNLDFTGPMNKKKTLLYRLNIGYENSGSFRNLQKNKSLLFAPSITFLPTDKTSINFDLVIQRFDGVMDRGQSILGATADTKLYDPNNTPINFAIGTGSDFQKVDANYFTFSLNHKFSEKLSFNSSFMKFFEEEEEFEHRTSNRFAVDAAGKEIPTLMGLIPVFKKQKSVTDNSSNYFVFKTKTGLIKHKILFGFDFSQYTTPIGNINAWGYRNHYKKKDGSHDKYSPKDKADFVLDADGNPVPLIPHFDLVNPTYKISPINPDLFGDGGESDPYKYYSTGYYIQDQITYNKLQVLLGLRYNQYFDVKDYKKKGEEKLEQTKLIPRLGLVYSINDKINIYGTYTESFEPIDGYDNTEEAGGPFDPELGTMFEVGMKSELLNKKLVFNVAAYTIKKKNELVEDPKNPDKYLQIGETGSKGIEFDLMGKLAKNLTLTANYAFNVTKYESLTADSDFKEGDIAPNSPKHQGGIFATYNIRNGFFNGMSVNFGTNFVSERSAWDPSLKIPSYVVSDFGLAYRVDKFVLRGTINNVFDKTHWEGAYDYGRVFPGTPRNYLLSVGYTF